MHVPTNTFSLKSKKGEGLVVRHDRPEKIDLTISTDTFIDNRSKCNFAPYVIKKIKY